MEIKSAVTRLAALAQDSRLAVFRHLVQLGPVGARPGAIAESLAVSPSTLSFHLKALAHAGLVQAWPDGRSIVYRADFAAMQELLDFLTENCCGGAPAACAITAPAARRPLRRTAPPSSSRRRQRE